MTAAVLCFWLVAGVGLGMAHAWFLAQVTCRPKQPPLHLSETRLLVVVAGFGFAAVAGGLVPTALGWAAGFATGCFAAWGESDVKVQVFHDPVLFRLGLFPITETMLTSLGVAIVVAITAAALGRALVQGANSFPAAIAEYAFETLDWLTTDIVGRSVPWLTAFSGSLFLFIAASNVLGQLPGIWSPMANLGSTSAMAVIVFLAVPVAGIREHGLTGYLKHYFQPNPLFMPLHLVSELSRTLALSVRLFGNMASGHLIVALLVSLVGLFVPVPMMALDLLIGLLQAYIFSILSTVYIGAALRAGQVS